jgi:integrase
MRNLRLNHGAYQVRFKLPEHLGGKRMEFSTKTADPVKACAIRDRLFATIRTGGVTVEVIRDMLAQAYQSDAVSRSIIDQARAELGIARPVGITIKEAGQRFIANRRDFKLRSGYTVYSHAQTLEALQAILGNLAVSQVTRQHMRDFRDKVITLRRYWNREEIDLTVAPEEERISAKTVFKMVKNASSFFNWCLMEELIDRNPAAGIDLPTVERNNTEPPPPHLADALCALPPLKRAETIGIIEWETLPWFYRYTGARCGEIGQLRLMDVVERDGILCLWVVTLKQKGRSQKTQGVVRRWVPVHPRLKPVLDRVLDARRGCAPESFLFPDAGHYFCKKENEWRYAHGWGNHYNDHSKKIWSKMRVHAWRSYAVTEMDRRGIPDEVRRAIIGHVPRDVHAGYNHVDLRRRLEGVIAIP